MRKTKIRVYMSGKELSEAVEKDLISLELEDEMEGAADSMTMTLADTSGIWSSMWRTSGEKTEKTTEFAIEGETEYYTVTASVLNVRNAPGTYGKIIETFEKGETVTVYEITDGWGKVNKNGEYGYVSMKYMVMSEKTAPTDTAIRAGDIVTVSGRPAVSSFGGRQGAAVLEHNGTVTKTNYAEGAEFPICVDSLGWFSTAAVTLTAEQKYENAIKDTPNGYGKGTTVDIIIHQEGAAQEFLNFELDECSMQGPPDVVTIKGTGLANESGIRREARTRIWEDMSVKEIAEKIAETGDMKLFFDAEDCKLERTEQNGISDIAFLEYICERLGLAVKAAGNMIVIFDEAEYERAEAVRTYRKDDLINWSFSTGFDDTAYTSCHVKYTNAEGKIFEYTYTPKERTEPEIGARYTVTGVRCYMRSEPQVREGNSLIMVPKGTTVTATGFKQMWIETEYRGRKGYLSTNSLSRIKGAGASSGQILEVEERVGSVDEARKLAQKRLREKNKNEFRAEIMLPMDVTTAAGNTVILSGEFGGWGGKYMIEKIKRSIGTGGSVDKMELYRPLEGY